MPLNPFRRNQEPEPVRPGSQGLARSTSGDTARIGDPVAVLSQALTEAQEETARWKRHADSYDSERAAAEELNDHYRDERDRADRDRDHAYRERAQLLAWLAALHPSSAVITASPDVDEDGWQLLYLVAGGWQMSWHIHPSDAELFKHVTVVDVTDPRAQWDGHGSEQKYERLRNHVRLLALDTLVDDGASTGVTTKDPSLPAGFTKAPYFAASCVICGYGFDEDESYACLFKSLDEAHKVLRDRCWTVLDDGRVVCDSDELDHQALRQAPEPEVRSA